ncbi:MAG: PIG-L family deacetylase, partial [Ornithinimicrobium sp.]
MSRLRRIAGSLVRTLPKNRADRLRARVRALERRLPGASREPITYVVSPHPDDETLRLAGYVTRLRERSSQRLVLVAISDGGASARARRMGWSPDYEREFRRAEQAAAWSALTGGTGQILRVGLTDGAVTAEDVRDALAPLKTKGSHFYVAAHEEDYHPDHRAVAAGVRLLNPPHMRFSLSPLMKGKGKVYTPSEQSAGAVTIAVAAYRDFGQLSVSKEFSALAKAGHRSRVTQWSGETTAIQYLGAQRASPAPGPGGGHQGEQRTAPIFVLGNQKSGTTAIAALLAECVGGTFVPDVLYKHRLKLKDLLAQQPSIEELARNHPKSFQATVVKDNDFTFLFPALEQAFPEARFVFVVRD